MIEIESIPFSLPTRPRYPRKIDLPIIVPPSPVPPPDFVQSEKKGSIWPLLILGGLVVAVGSSGSKSNNLSGASPKRKPSLPLNPKRTPSHKLYYMYMAPRKQFFEAKSIPKKQLTKYKKEVLRTRSNKFPARIFYIWAPDAGMARWALTHNPETRHKWKGDTDKPGRHGPETEQLQLLGDGCRDKNGIFIPIPRCINRPSALLKEDIPREQIDSKLDEYLRGVKPGQKVVIGAAVKHIFGQSGKQYEEALLGRLRKYGFKHWSTFVDTMKIQKRIGEDKKEIPAKKADDVVVEVFESKKKAKGIKGWQPTMGQTYDIDLEQALVEIINVKPRTTYFLIPLSPKRTLITSVEPEKSKGYLTIDRKGLISSYDLNNRLRMQKTAAHLLKPGKGKAQTENSGEFSSRKALVLALLQSEGEKFHIDKIAKRLNMKPYEVSAALISLELESKASQHAGKLFSARGKSKIQEQEEAYTTASRKQVEKKKAKADVEAEERGKRRDYQDVVLRAIGSGRLTVKQIAKETSLDPKFIKELRDELANNGDLSVDYQDNQVSWLKPKGLQRIESKTGKKLSGSMSKKTDLMLFNYLSSEAVKYKDAGHFAELWGHRQFTKNGGMILDEDLSVLKKMQKKSPGKFTRAEQALMKRYDMATPSEMWGASQIIQDHTGENMPGFWKSITGSQLSGDVQNCAIWLPDEQGGYKCGAYGRVCEPPTCEKLPDPNVKQIKVCVKNQRVPSAHYGRDIIRCKRYRATCSGSACMTDPMPYPAEPSERTIPSDSETRSMAEWMAEEYNREAFEKEPLLAREILSRGGIRAYRRGKEKEEYRAIPLFLKNKTGLPADEMAAEMDFDTDRDLIEAIVKEYPKKEKGAWKKLERKNWEDFENAAFEMIEQEMEAGSWAGLLSHRQKRSTLLGQDLFPKLRRELTLDPPEDIATSDDPITACMERRGWRIPRIEKLRLSISAKLTPDLFTGRTRKLSAAEKEYQRVVGECLESRSGTAGLGISIRAQAIRSSDRDTRAMTRYISHAGIKVNKDQTVTLYHGTTEKSAAAIQEAGKIRGTTGKNVMERIDNAAWFTPDREFAKTWGDEVIRVNVLVKYLRHLANNFREFYFVGGLKKDAHRKGEWIPEVYPRENWVIKVARADLDAYGTDAAFSEATA